MARQFSGIHRFGTDDGRSVTAIDAREMETALSHRAIFRRCRRSVISTELTGRVNRDMDPAADLMPYRPGLPIRL